MVMDVGGDINQFCVICFERNKVGVISLPMIFLFRNFEESLFFYKFDRKIIKFACVFQL